MLRLKTSSGWWLITHPEHARLAAQFAARWGNALFAPPEPRAQVLHGIGAHDDGWAARDVEPALSSRGEPAAFSIELVGKYSAFEEIDLAEYLAVRRNAVQLIAEKDSYAAILISMHTYNLLSERADRRTIRREQLPLLDTFLAEQKTLQETLRDNLLRSSSGTDAAQGPVASMPSEQDLSPETLLRNFQLLQACDNLSLVSCVDFSGEATLLHPFSLVDGRIVEVRIERTGERRFRLTPYPFDADWLTFQLRARFVPGDTFSSLQELQARFAAAPLQELGVAITA